MTHKGPRPVAWKDLDAEQRSCLQAISAAAEMRRDTDLRAWSEAQRARDLGVPERMIADCLKVSRATLQRQLAQRFPTLTDSKPPVATAPAVTALDQPPSQPAHATVAPAITLTPAKRPPSREETDTLEDLELSPASTWQPRHRPAASTDTLKDLSADPTSTRQPPPDEEPDTWSPRCVREAEGSELLLIVSKEVSAMSDEDVLACYETLNDMNRRALAEYLRDQQLHDQHSNEALMRFAVLLHQLHVRLQHAPRCSNLPQ